MIQHLVLEYSSAPFANAFNLGDEIQTLAASLLLPKVDGYIDRESLHEQVAPALVSMNGYFMHTRNWPPAPAVRPLFFAFHIAPHAVDAVCSPAGLEYLKRWQPIGCRDQGTVEILRSRGVEAYFSRCVTLTLPRREQLSEAGDVFMVGFDKDSPLRYLVPRSIRRNAVHVDQAEVRLPITNTLLKMQMAREVLDAYARRARLVITTKIHCAMPCLAMGIPVVFVCDDRQRDDYRIHTLKDLVTVNYGLANGYLLKRRNERRSKQINWEPEAPDISAVGQDVAQAFRAHYQRLVSD